MFKTLLSRIEIILGAIILAVIVGLVFVAAIMRTFNHPLIWSVDLAQLLFIWLCFLGAVKAMRERSHLGVDMLVRQLGFEHRLKLELTLSVVFVLLLVILAREGYLLSMLNFERQFGDSGIPYFYVTIAVPVGCILLSIAIIGNAIEAWQQRNKSDLLVFSKKTSNP